jgi:hypothetical protein
MGAAGVIALAAASGYAVGAEPADRFAAALFYSIIAAAGLAGPAIAWHLYRRPRLKPLGVLLGIVSAATLVTSVTQLSRAAPTPAAATAPATLPAGTPAPETSASVQAAAPGQDDLELQRIASERSGLYFSGTSTEALGAARAAYLAAQGAHYSKCVEGHDPKCAELAADLATKQTAFLAAVRDRTATEQAEKLDAEAARIRARLAAPSPQGPVKRLQDAVVRQAPMFETIPRVTVPSPRTFMILAAEIAIAAALIFWDVPGRSPKAAAASRTLDASPGRQARREQASARDLTRFVQACISPARGESVELRTLYLRFVDWCEEQRLSAPPPRAFTQEFINRCADVEIEVRPGGSDIVCLDVKLAPTRRA